jgi:hypothetical protein
MPSIFHQSPGMAARGLSLIDQSIARQPNGLVNVTVKYVAPAANVDQLLPQFTIDSAPPIYPDIIDANELQTRRLYLQNFTAEKSAGLATINAQYCGALLRGLQTPYQTNQFEQRVITINNLAFLGPLRTGLIAGTLTRGDFVDGYEFTYRSRIAYYEDAIVGDQDFQIPLPVIVNTPTTDGLIVGWTLNSFSKQIPLIDGSLVYEGFYRRNFTAEQWLELLVAELGGRPWFGPFATTDVDNVTPTVRVIRQRVNLVAPRSVTLSSEFAPGFEEPLPNLPRRPQPEDSFIFLPPTPEA